MVTTPEGPEAPTTLKEDVVKASSAIRAEALRSARSLLTGDANGRMRRNLLFVVALFGYIVPAIMPLGVAALLLLALTDMVVAE